MTTRKKAAATKTRGAVAGVAGQLAALHEMTVADLRERYREVFGEPSRSRNKVWLRKKVAWRIQELAEGGLSDDARRRIQELGPGAPVRWRASNGGTPKEARAPDTRPRDPALPPPGTVLTRLYRGAEHHVTVLEEGFEYEGARHRSLSKVAFEITGTRWNGFLFFRLKNRTRKASGEAGA